ncbi:MAG: hypothetical protein KDE27_00605 [Planctomycetes bacterium]|nr:hypothetical protein [Planctomycetota bacterium]
MSKLPGLSLVLSTSAVFAQCIPAPGTQIVIAQDSISGPHAIGFAFPIFGATYTDLHVSDHGICFLSNAGVPGVPPATPLVYSPAATSMTANGPVLCPFWSDTIPGAQGAFYVDAQSTQCTVTWANVQSFGYAEPLMTFQMTLFPNGEIEFVYDPQVTNNSTYASPGDHGVIGVSPGMPAALPIASDLSASPTTIDATVFEEFAVAGGFDMAVDALRLVPMNPGWAVTHVHEGSGCAYVEAYGNGCEGMVLTSNPPALGTIWELETDGLNVVSQIGFTFFAFGRAPNQPFSSFGLNAPGCEGHLPLNFIVTRLVGVNTNGHMSVTVTMPTVAPWLIGESFTNQTFGFTNQNLAGIAASNALECTMGN